MTNEFDFESFIAGIAPTEVTIEVSSVDHSYEIERLEEILSTLPEHGEETGKRAAQKSQRTLIEKQIADLRAEEDSSPGLSFRLRPLLPDEFRDLNDDADSRYVQMAAQCVEPRLSVEQWRTLGEKLQTPRFNKLVTAATSLTLREGKSPAFSPSASAGRRNSSQN